MLFVAPIAISGTECATKGLRLIDSNGNWLWLVSPCIPLSKVEPRVSPARGISSRHLYPCQRCAIPCWGHYDGQYKKSDSLKLTIFRYTINAQSILVCQVRLSVAANLRCQEAAYAPEYWLLGITNGERVVVLMSCFQVSHRNLVIYYENRILD